MGACSIFAQRLKSRLDHLLPLNPTTSCCSSLMGSPTNPEDCIFFNLYEYHWTIRSFSCRTLKSSSFAENRNIQKHIRPFRPSFAYCGCIISCKLIKIKITEVSGDAQPICLILKLVELRLLVLMPCRLLFFSNSCLLFPQFIAHLIFIDQHSHVLM